MLGSTSSTARIFSVTRLSSIREHDGDIVSFGSDLHASRFFLIVCHEIAGLWTSFRHDNICCWQPDLTTASAVFLKSKGRNSRQVCGITDDSPC